MVVKRIVANIAAENLGDVRDFYESLFGLTVAMDLGWIATLATGGQAGVQISVGTQGGSGTAVPNLSIEVDDVDAVYDRAVAGGHGIEYGPVDEPWGVRRFYVRDPAGTLINVLSHQTDSSPD